MMTRLTLSMTVVIGLVVAAGCGGDIGEPPLTTSMGPPSGPPGPTARRDSLCTSAVNVAFTPLRRLTRVEYDNTIRVLLGDDTHPADAFPPDESLIGFASGAAVSPLLAERYQGAAEALAANAVANIATLLPCDPATGEDACAREFIERFGKRAYRRPLTSEEIDELVTIYTDTKPLDGFSASIELVLTAMLQSPSFLYRIELGTSETDVTALSQYEIASRLSYFFWASMPDDELFAAADAGELATLEQVEAQARRMLASDKAHAAVANFYSQFLELDRMEGLSKDPDYFPTSAFNPNIASAMEQSTRRFVDYVMFEGDGKLDTLFTSPLVFVNEALAPVYGITGVTGRTFVQRMADPAQRAGILTQASAMAMLASAYQTSPVQRGKFVRERLLCQQLPSPPEGLVVVPPEPDPSATTRERYSEHSTNPDCAGCHMLMDPIGFGFENYDAIGRYQTVDDGIAVDSSGEVFASRDIDGSFANAIDLAHKLAGSDEAHECATKQWFRYAFSRLEDTEDACSMETLHTAFEESGYDIRELLVALTQTEAFLNRRADLPAEVSP